MLVNEHRVGWESVDLADKLCISIANLKIDEADGLANLDGQPNDSPKRFEKFNTLLNDMRKVGTHLAVFPEVCIPYKWLPWVVLAASHREMGIVIGLEHVVRQNVAYNYILTVLPYKAKGKFRGCYFWPRLKRYSAPHEEMEVKGRKLTLPPIASQPHDIFKWRGVNFTVFNCFELTHIQERAAFCGRIDFLVCPEFNKDIRYFSNIVEAASRDLHCFVVQSNDSKHGDSRVVAPRKTELMNLAQIKGGENETFLMATLDIKTLRQHQTKSISYQLYRSKEFKPTPAGWDSDLVKKRSAK